MACAACSTTAGRRSWSARSTARPAAGRAMDSTSSKRKSVTGRTPRSYYYPVILSHPRNIKMKNKNTKNAFFQNAKKHASKISHHHVQDYKMSLLKTSTCPLFKTTTCHCPRLQHVIVQDYNMSLFKTTTCPLFKTTTCSLFKTATCHCSRLQHVHCSRLKHFHRSRLQHVHFSRLQNVIAQD